MMIVVRACAQVWIEKTSGCNHMTCSRCNTEFCYVCGDRYLQVKFLGGHESRFSVLGCRFSLLPRYPPLRMLIRGLILGASLPRAPPDLLHPAGPPVFRAPSPLARPHLDSGIWFWF